MLKPSKGTLFFILTVFFIAHHTNTIAQIPLYRFDFKTEFGVPIVMGSKAYKKTFGGIFNGNMALNIHTKKGFIYGLGSTFLFTKLGNNRNVAISNFEAKNFTLTPHLFIGLETISSEKARLGFTIGYGYGFTSFNKSFIPDSITTKPNLKQSFPSLLVAAYLKLFTDENLSFTFKIDYMAQFYAYNPFYYYYEYYNSFLLKSDISKANHIICIGLGFSYHFKELKTIQVNIE